VIQGTSGVIQRTSGVIQGTFDVIQGTFDVSFLRVPIDHAAMFHANIQSYKQKNHAVVLRIGVCKDSANLSGMRRLIPFVSDGSLLQDVVGCGGML
jgi:hypothetical protein